MQPQQKLSGSGPGSGDQSGAIVCAQCGSPMPPEMRFCRACGNRLGEGPAEYTETVRLPNSAGAAPFYPSVNAPLAQQTGRDYPRRRRLGFSGMTWMWIVLGLFFASGGFMSAFVNGVRNIPHVTGNVAPRSYAGIQDLHDADGGVSFDYVSPPGGPADKAGLVGGDIITSLDGHLVKNEAEIMALLRQTAIGKQVEVIYARDGDFHNTQLTTVSKETLDQLTEAFSDRAEGQGRFGFDDGDAKKVTLPGTKISGVQLGDISANLPADMAGIKKGDIVTEFDGTPIRTVDELTYRVRRVVPYTTITVVVMRDGKRLEVPVKLGKR
jgi:membrane-associated protease RseP (regulator of RpoE activity)